MKVFQAKVTKLKLEFCMNILRKIVLGSKTKLTFYRKWMNLVKI